MARKDCRKVRKKEKKNSKFTLGLINSPRILGVLHAPACRGGRKIKTFNRSFSRDVITFQNLKLKIHQIFYPHQAKEVAYLYLFTILQLNSLLRFKTRAF